ncbi:hypothetical protein ABZX64_14405 [Streptomyces misionensis]|uniref:hypothetical protein n=1 Tax=Streptomyces misionensis TaxID=67331 RepID=UPI0033BE5472
MPRTSLSRRLAERFREIDGGHPTTGADDAYVGERFVLGTGRARAAGSPARTRRPHRMIGEPDAGTGVHRVRPSPLRRAASRDVRITAMRARFPRP